MIILSIFILFMATITGAVLYRARGGWPDIPRPFEQMAFCAVFLFTLAIIGVDWYSNGLSYVLAVVAVLTGHGLYFLDRNPRATEPERLDFIVKWFFGEDPRTAEFYKKHWRNHSSWYHINMPKTQEWLDDVQPQLIEEMNQYGMNKLYWRCVTGMAITGGAVSLAPGLVLMFVNPWAGVVVALSGFISKPLAYIVSYKIGEATEGGEFGTGGLQWFIVALVAVMCMVPLVDGVPL